MPVEGLAEAIAACKPDVKHKTIIQVLEHFPRLQGARLATTGGGQGDRWLAARKVLAADGTLVHHDHSEWLREQLQADSGSTAATYERLCNAGYLLTECAVTSLHLVVPGVSLAASDFLQIDVDLLEERIDRKAFGPAWGRISDLRELVHLMEEGETLPDDQRTRYQAPAYKLVRVIDVAVLLEEIDQLDRIEREQLKGRTWTVTDMS